MKSKLPHLQILLCALSVILSVRADASWHSVHINLLDCAPYWHEYYGDSWGNFPFGWSPTHPVPHDHVDQHAYKMTTDTADDNAVTGTEFKCGWLNECNISILKPALSVDVTAQVTVHKTLSVTLGQGESTSYKVECAKKSKSDTEGKIGWSHSWDEQASATFTSGDYVIGVGVTDHGPPQDTEVGPYEGLYWCVYIHSKVGDTAYECRREHYCEGVCTYPGCGVTRRSEYSGHGVLDGSGSSEGENPCSVFLAYWGVM
jgi:hypothetical protein